MAEAKTYYQCMLHYIGRNDTNESGRSRKFYEVRVAYFGGDGGSTYQVTRKWGRIGSAGQIKGQWFNSRRQAMAAAMELVNGKKQKGYRVSSESEIEPERPKKPPLPKHARNRCQQTDSFGIWCKGYIRLGLCDTCGIEMGANLDACKQQDQGGIQCGGYIRANGPSAGKCVVCNMERREKRRHPMDTRDGEDVEKSASFADQFQQFAKGK